MDAHGKMLEIRKLIDESYGLIPESEPVRRALRELDSKLEAYRRSMEVDGDSRVARAESRLLEVMGR